MLDGDGKAICRVKIMCNLGCFVRWTIEKEIFDNFVSGGVNGDICSFEKGILAPGSASGRIGVV